VDAIFILHDLVRHLKIKDFRAFLSILKKRLTLCIETRYGINHLRWAWIVNFNIYSKLCIQV
jgi:hypothetical protein